MTDVISRLTVKQLRHLLSQLPPGADDLEVITDALGVPGGTVSDVLLYQRHVVLMRGPEPRREPSERLRELSYTIDVTMAQRGL